ncbi:corticotropin releasing hormone b [Clupea harengus]|uniref:Corticotropin releasing hormone b n=1 Tax=Clupea harengus TaxID=7950 RepID=A0A6P3VH20_CLUHA|nr:corticotropin releasing hormone b [Clupea harengus]
MKLNFFATFVLLVAFPPRYECRAIDSPSQQAPGTEHDPQQSLPILARVGEEYFIRLGNENPNSPLSATNMYSETSPSVFKRALQLQLTQRLLQGRVGNVKRLVANYAQQLDDSMERERRSEEPPISLDLTFHLLREVLEMARAEQYAQQAHSNRKMMELFGK